MPVTRKSRKKTTLPKVDFQKTLRDVAKSMVRLKKSDRLVKLVTRLIDKEVSVSHASLLVLDEERARYTFIDSKGAKKLPLGFIKFDDDHPLIHWFCQPQKGSRATDDFLYLVDVSSKKTQRKGLLRGRSQEQLDAVIRAMKNLKAELAVPSYFKGALLGILLLGKKNSNRLFTSSEIAFFQVLAQDCSMAIKTARYHESLHKQNLDLQEKIEEIEKLRQREKDSYYEILKSLAQQVYQKDKYTFGHVQQVERLGVMTARELKYDLAENEDILKAGLVLHDVGKIAIPDHILNKPARLDEEEWKIMQTHVDKGYEILKPMTAFKRVADIVRCHHENFDGSGYPRGLKGKDIPIESRIVSVVDAFHAIVSTRCYSKGRPVEVAFDELRRCAGTQFDPTVVEAFICGMQKEMKKRGVGFF